MSLDRREFNLAMAGFMAPASGGKYDVAVIGAGVFGAWIAHACHSQGKSVLLLDCRGPANALASSGGESRILRVGYGPQELYSQWAKTSLDNWQERLREMKQDSLFYRSGLLWVGAETDSYLRATAANLKKLAVRFEYLDTNQLRRRYTQMSPPKGSIGILETGSGYILARRAVEALVADLRLRGVTYKQALIPAPLPALNGRLTELVTSGGERIDAGQFVFACGPWLPKSFPDLLAKCITPTRQEVFFFAAPAGSSEFSPAKFPAWIDFRENHIFYGMPDTEDRGFKAAADQHGKVVDPETQERIASAAALDDVRAFLRERFPKLAHAPCVESRVCQYENSATGDFIIDRHPKADNVWIVGAGSGHGFKHGPAVGQHVIELLHGGAPKEQFSLSRALRLSEGGRTVH